ncbi:PfkB family carbohydrate kinase [Janibacter sp. CX7]|uniref:PfkB family carbohydrate kinase n=1 Tax=Janibacter sp. CX7 TaxID=2963431 RepID=UPI0020CE348A|nr:PfkB family carbohydrate kinase [Janibacter sp. CX7]UTT66697.1 PfkB family carbohydrate kinase [Janibacter sp. CX7]
MPRRRRSAPPAPTLVIGESLVDVVVGADGQRSEHVGGSPLNVAVGLARLDHPVTLATHFGRDARGAAIGEHLAAAGVALVPGSDRARDTSIATATLDGSGAATYTFDLDWRLPELPEVGGHVHTGSLGALLRPGGVDVLSAMTGAARAHTISYDPNCRPDLMPDRDAARAEIERRIAVSDVVKASDEDIAWLAGRPLDHNEIADVLRSWRDLGPALAVCTLGAAGALAILPSGRRIQLRAPRVDVVDTVGAGDSFMAGLLSGLLDAGLLGGAEPKARLRKARGRVVSAAIERAVDAAARTVAHAGAHAPSRADLGVDAAR